MLLAGIVLVNAAAHQQQQQPPYRPTCEFWDWSAGTDLSSLSPGDQIDGYSCECRGDCNFELHVSDSGGSLISDSYDVLVTSSASDACCPDGASTVNCDNSGCLCEYDFSGSTVQTVSMTKSCNTRVNVAIGCRNSVFDCTEIHLSSPTPQTFYCDTDHGSATEPTCVDAADAPDGVTTYLSMDDCRNSGECQAATYDCETMYEPEPEQQCTDARYDGHGQYPSLASCQDGTACEPISGYDCGSSAGECIPQYRGAGRFQSRAKCEDSEECNPGNAGHYVCDNTGTGGCTGPHYHGSGSYNTLTACETSHECNSANLWSCNRSGTTPSCMQVEWSPSKPVKQAYIGKHQCEANCQPAPTPSPTPPPGGDGGHLWTTLLTLLCIAVVGGLGFVARRKWRQHRLFSQAASEKSVTQRAPLIRAEPKQELVSNNKAARPARTAPVGSPPARAPVPAQVRAAAQAPTLKKPAPATSSDIDIDIAAAALQNFLEINKFEQFAPAIAELGIGAVKDFETLGDDQLLAVGMNGIQLKRLRRQVKARAVDLSPAAPQTKNAAQAAGTLSAAGTLPAAVDASIEATHAGRGNATTIGGRE
jgi:hypothetical protein